MPPKQKRARTFGQSKEVASGNTVDSDEDSSGSEEMDNVSDSDPTGSDSDGCSSVDSHLEIQVDFEARVINDDDFHGIRRLLRQPLLKYSNVFLKSNVDVSGLVNLVLEQTDNVGSTVKVCDNGDLQTCDPPTESTGEVISTSDSDGDQVYGVTSVISLAYHQDKLCVKQVKEMLLSQCKAHGSSVLSSFSTLLSKRIGLLINERFLNIPSEIAPPLLNGLMMELKAASKKLEDQFSCEYYLLLTRSHMVSLPTANNKRKRKDGRKKGTMNTGATAAGENTPVFDYIESELLHKDSVVSFSYPVSEESDQVLGGKWSFDDLAMKPYRTVMVFEAHTFEKAVSQLEEKFT